MPAEGQEVFRALVKADDAAFRTAIKRLDGDLAKQKAEVDKQEQRIVALRKRAAALRRRVGEAGAPGFFQTTGGSAAQAGIGLAVGQATAGLQTHFLQSFGLEGTPSAGLIGATVGGAGQIGLGFAFAGPAGAVGATIGVVVGLVGQLFAANTSFKAKIEQLDQQIKDSRKQAEQFREQFQAAQEAQEAALQEQFRKIEEKIAKEQEVLFYQTWRLMPS